MAESLNCVSRRESCEGGTKKFGGVQKFGLGVEIYHDSTDIRTVRLNRNIRCADSTGIESK